MNVHKLYVIVFTSGVCACACVDVVMSIHSRCSPLTTSTTGQTPAVELYGRGYLSSPNYPDKYYMDAECRWRVRVQPKQTIRFTIFDFELDIKRAGRCKDYVQISSVSTAVTQSKSWYWPRSSLPPSPIHFRDCGALGRHTIQVNFSLNHCHSYNHNQSWFLTIMVNSDNRYEFHYYDHDCDPSQLQCRRHSLRRRRIQSYSARLLHLLRRYSAK